MADFRARLLARVQQGLPLQPRPFLALAGELGVTEDEVLAELAALERDGFIREFSAMFDPAALGCCSTLACMTVPEEKLEAVTALLADLPEVTHNYLRAHAVNVWFTLIAPSPERLQGLLDAIAAQTGCEPIHSLPATKVYKIRVAFAADEMRP